MANTSHMIAIRVAWVDDDGKQQVRGTTGMFMYASMCKLPSEASGWSKCVLSRVHVWLAPLACEMRAAAGWQHQVICNTVLLAATLGREQRLPTSVAVSKPLRSSSCLLGLEARLGRQSETASGKIANRWGT